MTINRALPLACLATLSLAGYAAEAPDLGGVLSHFPAARVDSSFAWSMAEAGNGTHRF